MGRPRLHDERTRHALLEAAERLLSEAGIDAVGVRSVADAAGTSTRAVYAVFGSKEEMVQALATRAYELLIEQVAAVPLTTDAGADLISGSVQGFRQFALDHPDLFKVFFTATQRPMLDPAANATRLASFDTLIRRMERARSAGLLGSHTLGEGVLLWDVMCSGLAMREACGQIPHGGGERIWIDALTALLIGLGSHDPQ